MKTKEKNMSGITLIALIITVIVLLILAGVSIALVVGENGALNQASKSKSNTEFESEKEKVYLAINSSKINEEVEVDKDVLKQELNSYFGEDNYELTGGNELGYYIIKIGANEYKALLNGEVVDIEKESLTIIGNSTVKVGSAISLMAQDESGNALNARRSKMDNI